MSAVLELEYLKGPTDHAGVRAKKRRTTRSERRKVKMVLAGAIVADVAYERFDKRDVPKERPPVFYDDVLDIYFQFDREIDNFVRVPWYVALQKALKGKGKSDDFMDDKGVLTFIDEHFSGYVHPRYDNKGGDTVNDSCRMNTVCRWLRSMAGKSWNEVNAELIARFNGKGEFLWSRNVHEFCGKVKGDAFRGFFVDESGTFRCRQTKFHQYAPDKPAPKRKNLAERLAAKEDIEREIKKIFREKRFMTSNRKKKRLGWKSELRAA